MARLLDISPPLSPRLAVWPGDAPFELSTSMAFEKGDAVRLSSIRTTLHVGAHADAPAHLAADGMWASAMPLEPFYGICEVVRVRVAPGAAIRPGDLPGPPAAPRVLFRTDSFLDPECWADDFAGLSPELVDLLADRGVVLVGLDTPSVDPFERADLPAHLALLRRGVFHLEGLSLRLVDPGIYTLIALPLAVEGGDAAPLRAALVADLRPNGDVARGPV